MGDLNARKIQVCCLFLPLSPTFNSASRKKENTSPSSKLISVLLPMMEGLTRLFTFHTCIGFFRLYSRSYWIEKRTVKPNIMENKTEPISLKGRFRIEQPSSKSSGLVRKEMCTAQLFLPYWTSHFHLNNFLLWQLCILNLAFALVYSNSRSL